MDSPFQKGKCNICGDESQSHHMHHIIPRAYGGERGPVVELCNDCHEGIHHCAETGSTIDEYNKRPDRRTEFLSGSVHNAIVFINAIRNAKALVSDSPNKGIRFCLFLTAKENQSLEILAKKWDVSKQDVIRTLIRRG